MYVYVSKHRRDFDFLEKRRMKAIALLGQGLSQSEVARRLGVCSQTVSRWNRMLSATGVSALRKAGRAGRKPKLAASARKRLEKLLLRGPEMLGYKTPRWTCQRVAHLLRQEFNVDYHTGHVWKILVGMGWSCRRERDKTPARRWRKAPPSAGNKDKPKAHDASCSPSAAAE